MMNRNDEHMVEHSLEDLEQVTGGVGNTTKPGNQDGSDMLSAEWAHHPKLPHTVPNIPEQSKREKVKKL